MAGERCDDIVIIPNMTSTRCLYVDQVKVPCGHRENKNSEMGEDVMAPVRVMGAGILDSILRPSFNGLFIE